jgi:hypothetical protein
MQKDFAELSMNLHDLLFFDLAIRPVLVSEARWPVKERGLRGVRREKAAASAEANAGILRFAQNDKSCGW